ncbi:NIF3-like protein 1 [Thrips palmi]|uniref:NIF3-like protein 1 n=1 Tax=Thrips palmi TaxID=161013 RepID=A0A6P8ZMK4_THRPL|nr:NIF3-like protein 1 [Thrips palmi]
MTLLCSVRRCFLAVERFAWPVEALRTMPRKRKHGSFSQSYYNDPCSLESVVRKIETFAPRQLAESWDNVGLLVSHTSPKLIKKILLTNDLTEEVLEEAIEVDAQLVISYHPLIFPSVKSVNSNNWKERIVGTLLHKQIALYCPHTAWDCVEGGVNDWLAGAFESKNASVTPLKRYNEGCSSKIVNALFPNGETAEKAMGEIKAALPCNMNVIDQRDGKVWLKIYIDEEYKCIPFLRSALDIDISVHTKMPTRFNAGAGRKVLLKEPIPLQLAVMLVKEHTGLADVAVAVASGETTESKVSSIALCAGSGGSVLKGVDADLYLTGEMSHHEVLDAVHKGVHVILTRHSNSERGFLKIAATQHLKNLMPEIDFVVSSKDRDPLETM